jgi:hypothetical protein
MVRLGPKLEQRQMVLFRAVDIGAELFAMSATCSRARMLASHGSSNATELANVFCREARLRIADHFRNLFGPNDASLYRLSQGVMKGEYEWLEEGIVAMEGPDPDTGQTEGGRGRELQETGSKQS